MKKSDFESFQRGIAEAEAFLQGAGKGYIVHEPVDVRDIRARTRLTREKFATRYGLDPRTVEQWEQGRRHPDRATVTYLRLIESEPDKVAELVADLKRD